MNGQKDTPPEQIIDKLCEAEILLNQGATIAVVSKRIGASDYTYYRWRKEYSGMRVDQARRLKELEQANSRLKKLAANLFLDWGQIAIFVIDICSASTSQCHGYKVHITEALS